MLPIIGFTSNFKHRQKLTQLFKKSLLQHAHGWGQGHHHGRGHVQGC